MQIEIKDLVYTYSEKSKDLAVRALDGVSLTVNEGEFFGIVGHTGSGKTTFVQHLNGLIKLGKNNGSIVIGDFNLADKKCDFKALRSKVGMVFQYPEYQLFAETVKDDVAFGIKNFFPKIEEKEKEDMVRSAIEMVGLNYNKIKDKSPFELSGGQKRRVAIAGVIVTKPEILVLDEPAAGLDPKGKKEFLDLLHYLHGTVIKTIIIVSHDMNLVSEHCNRAAIFSKGKIDFVGTPKEIFSRYDDVERLGLDLPVTAYLTKALEEKGEKIDSDLTVDGFISAFTEKFAKGDKK